MRPPEGHTHGFGRLGSMRASQPRGLNDTVEDDSSPNRKKTMKLAQVTFEGSRLGGGEGSCQAVVSDRVVVKRMSSVDLYRLNLN